MGMGEESAPGCCEIICRLFLSFIYNCYPHLERPRSWKEVVGFSGRFINQSTPAVHTAWRQASELIREMQFSSLGIYIGMMKGEVTINSMEQNEETCM